MQIAEALGEQGWECFGVKVGRFRFRFKGLRGLRMGLGAMGR